MWGFFDPCLGSREESADLKFLVFWVWEGKGGEKVRR